MVTRQERIDAFTHQGVPPANQPLEVLCEDHVGTSMSYHFCDDGVAVLGTVWIPASQSKLQSSAGACVDGTGRSQIRRATAARARLKYKVENRWLVLNNRISSSDKRWRPRRGRSRWKSFAPRPLTRRWQNG